MKKVVLMLAIAGFIGVGVSSPAVACEGKKCTMDHSGKEASKSKKGKKNAKEESCHKPESSSEATKACCMKKDNAKAETSKVKEKK